MRTAINNRCDPLCENIREGNGSWKCCTALLVTTLRVSRTVLPHHGTAPSVASITGITEGEGYAP